MKKNSINIEEITRHELSTVETNDKLAKLEKESLKNKKIIDEYKDREKATARALIIYERKVRWLKETLVNELLDSCKTIDKFSDAFNVDCERAGVSDTVKRHSADLKVVEEKLYEICNKLEANAIITQSDRDFISNKKPPKPKKAEGDMDSRFDKLRTEFDQKIGKSVLRKPGRPKKQDESIVASIGLGHKPGKKIEQDESVKEKLNKIFYDAPTKNKKAVASTIPESSDSVFDFDEALNPNVSLKDIMADLMTEKEDEIKVHSNTSIQNEIKEAQNKTRAELIESGFLRNPTFKQKTTAPAQTEIKKETPKKATFEQKFLSLQDVFDETK
ncbi:MAG: hypothetical protein IJ538_04570 [Clostridia bacterium]|nr:hypothetical protein [Clostridia bacterium]